MKSPLRFSMRRTIRIFVLAVLAATVLMSVGANAGIVPELSGSSSTGPDSFSIGSYGAYNFGPGKAAGEFQGGSTTVVYDWVHALTFTGVGPYSYFEVENDWEVCDGGCVEYFEFTSVMGASFRGQWSNGLWADGDAGVHVDYICDSTMSPNACIFSAINGTSATLSMTTYSPEPGTALLITGGVALLGLWKPRFIG